MVKKLIPFNLMPGSWGLKGKTREIAKAEYELEGYELKKKLLEIKSDDLSEKELKKKFIDLDFEFGKVDKITHLRMLSNLIEDEQQKKLAMLELDLKEGKLTDTEYQKQSATLRGEPWITVLNMDFGGKQSLEGSFELDWNEAFVDNLMKEGYVGPTPDAIVNQWFMEVCRNIAMEEFDGTGNFTADSAANLEAVKRWSSPEPDSTGRRGYK